MSFLLTNQQRQSTEGLMDVRFYRRQDAWPTCFPTNSDSSMKTYALKALWQCQLCLSRHNHLCS